MFSLSNFLFGQTPTGWPGCETTWPTVYLTANNCLSGQWELVLEDDFNYPVLDTLKWIPRTPWGDPPNHSTFNLPENIVLGDGNARLMVKKEPGYYPVPWCSQNPTLTWYDWTGAEMCTFDRFQYGRFEMKCTIPRGVGYWPAFWLYGSTQDHPEEIDIFEFWNEWIIYWLNWKVMDWGKMSKNQHLSIHHCDWEDASEQMGGDFWIGSWIFSLEWDTFTVKWFVKEDGGANEILIREDYHFFTTPDGIPISSCGEIQPDMPYLVNTTFPTIPMGLIASFKMGRDRLGPNNSTPDTGSFIIDYIKVYRKQQCDFVLQECSMGDLANYPTSIYAKDIILGDDVGNCFNEIQGIDFNFLASGKIILKPAFHIKPSLLYQICGNTNKYSAFSAKIVGCNQNNLLESDQVEPDLKEKFRLNSNSIAKKPVIADMNNNNASKLCEIFPNPSHGDITIVFIHRTDINKIEVFNDLGILIKQESNIGEIQKVKINIMNGPGIYLLIIHLSDSGIIRKKVVID